MPDKNRHSALWVANRFTIWRSSFFRFLINGKTNERGDLGFYLLWGKKPMLQLTLIADRSDQERQFFYITVGWLVKEVWLRLARIWRGVE